jgi:hypothetical protein
MNSALEFFHSVDLASFVQNLIAFIDSADPCFVAVIVGLFTLLGSKMAAPYPALHSWGLRLAAAVFLLYGGYAYLSQGGLDADNLPRVAVRGLIAAGTALAPVWIVLPILTFVYGRLRLALAAFLLYGTYAFVALGSFDVEALPSVALRALLAAGLALVVAWIVQPVVDILTANLPGKPRARPRPGPEEEQRVISVPRPAVSEVQQALADAQRRRNRARLKAELLYSLYAPDLSDRFGRDRFDDFVGRYLGDQHEPEDVEENGRQLEAVLQQHVEKILAPEPFDNLTDLTRWYLGEQKRLQALHLDEETKHRQLARLNQRYQHLAEQLLETLPA